MMRRTALLFCCLVASSCGKTEESRVSPGGLPVTTLVSRLTNMVACGVEGSVVVAHGISEPQRLLCRPKGCEGLPGGCAIYGISVFQGVVERSLWGKHNIDDVLTVASISTGGFVQTERGREAWSNLQQWSDAPGVYLLRPFIDASTNSGVLKCENGEIEITDLSVITMRPSWLDAGGPGWYRASDVEKLIAYLQDHPYPKTCDEQLEVWTEVTGRPLPEGTEGCPGGEPPHVFAACREDLAEQSGEGGHLPETPSADVVEERIHDVQAEDTGSTNSEGERDARSLPDSSRDSGTSVEPLDEE